MLCPVVMIPPAYLDRRTIHGMVYNALKLFMEINPDLFDESMHQYRQHKIEWVSGLAFPSVFRLNFNSEQDHAVAQYNAWQRMREKALQNAPGHKFPEAYVEPYRAPPPPPTAVDDADIMDLSLELNAASIEDVPGDLDESGLERVPMADPGLDVRQWISFLYLGNNAIFLRNV